MKRIAHVSLYRKHMFRTFNSGQLNRDKSLEPFNTEASDNQFSEMMDDRTNALFRSLGVDESRFQDKGSESKFSFADSAQAIPSRNDPSKKTKINSATLPSRTKFGIYCDTQGIYSDLRSSGLTAGQSEVLMRTVQELINELVALCKHRAVPISAAANEAYLFDAASSEVRNEISNSRQMQATSYRSGLARLQRDIEILEHSAAEMTNLLKSDLDIEVHERKNSARAEESVVQLKIQELYNKIGTRLNSELKSEIENLRWQITRRSLTAIAVVAASLIWMTQNSSSKNTAKSQELQNHAKGQALPVHILPPSMAPSEDSLDNLPTLVEDLNTVSNLNHPMTDETSEKKVLAKKDSSTSNETP